MESIIVLIKIIGTLMLSVSAAVIVLFIIVTLMVNILIKEK